MVMSVAPVSYDNVPDPRSTSPPPAFGRKKPPLGFIVREHFVMPGTWKRLFMLRSVVVDEWMRALEGKKDVCVDARRWKEVRAAWSCVVEDETDVTSTLERGVGQK